MNIEIKNPLELLLEIIYLNGRVGKDVVEMVHLNKIIELLKEECSKEKTGEGK